MYRIKKRKRIKKSEEPDNDYGLNVISEENNFDEEICNKKKENFLRQLRHKWEEIPELTKHQRNSSLWFEERRKRLTASHFGRRYKLRQATDKAKVAKDLLKPTFLGNISTQYGIEHEPIAIETFQEYTNKKIEICGLLISAEFPYLAASSDGLVVGEKGLIEVKCPYNARNYSPDEAIRNKIIKFAVLDENNQLCFKKSDRYYGQMQGQLYICKKDFCYFRIKKDETYWTDMFKHLATFYFNFLLPEILKEF